MEMHHHSHSEGHIGGKKNWKSYLWEFLMLFLAVFCGFLAEYQLEHMIEKDRANELAKSFYEELKNDSSNVLIKVENRIKQENALKYLMKYFRDSSVTNVSKTFVINFLYGISFRSLSLFEPRTVVLDQLKNSGSLRYFKNEKLQKLIGDISVAIHNVNDRQSIEWDLRRDYLNPLIINHYDFDFDAALTNDWKVNIFQAAAEYEKNNEFIPFQLKSIEKFDRQNMINILGFYCMNGMRSTRLQHIQKYIEINTELLRVLRNEYHLE